MNNKEYKNIAILIIVQVTIAVCGFLTLMAVFDFPDILRKTSVERLSLFIENSTVIIPTYYMLALTGITQVLISIMFFQLFKSKSTVVLLSAIFGVLCGIFQTIGFIRWPFLIPYLAEMKDVTPEIVAFVEGAFNHYAGMAIGENLGFLMQGFWTLCFSIAILKNRLFTYQISWAGIIIGSLTLLISYEPFGGIFTSLGELTNPVISAWYIWLTFLAISLLRSVPKQDDAPEFGVKSAILAVIFWLLFVVPAYL